MHINGNSKDNRLCNLQWGLPKENTLHKYLHGTISAKLTLKQINQIKHIWHVKKITQQKLADLFLVNQSQISRIINNKTWVTGSD